MPFLIRLSVFVALTLVIGLGSAWRAADKGFFATTRALGPWVTWHRAGTADADPYTLAHFAREGTLPMTAGSFLSFTATRDSSGSRLSGSCTYEIKGYSFPSLWWNIASFTKNGQPVESKTGRSSFNMSNILAAADGRFTVRLSPEVQSGNWLPSPNGERVVLRLNILRPLNAGRLLDGGSDAMPEITLVDCT